MEKFEISSIWQGWELEGLLGKGPFGNVFLAKKGSGEEPEWKAIKIITVPPAGYEEEVVW